MSAPNIASFSLSFELLAELGLLPLCSAKKWWNFLLSMRFSADREPCKLLVNAKHWTACQIIWLTTVQSLRCKEDDNKTLRSPWKYGGERILLTMTILRDNVSSAANDENCSNVVSPEAVMSLSSMALTTTLCNPCWLRWFFWKTEV